MGAWRALCRGLGPRIVFAGLALVLGLLTFGAPAAAQPAAESDVRTVRCELEAKVIEVFDEAAAPAIPYDHARVARLDVRRFIEGDDACDVEFPPGTARLVGLSGNVQNVENGSIVTIEAERMPDGGERWRVLQLEPPDAGSPLVFFAIVFVGFGVLIFGTVIVVLLRSRGKRPVDAA